VRLDGVAGAEVVGAAGAAAVLESPIPRSIPIGILISDFQCLSIDLEYRSVTEVAASGPPKPKTFRSNKTRRAISVSEAQATSSDPSVRKVDFKLEVQIIPVSEVERSKEFYQGLGWRLDHDVAPLDGLRIVQFTPPGSGTSVTFGSGLTTATPGSAEGDLVVSDIEAAHDELVGRGIDVSDVWHGPPFPPRHANPAPTPSARATGRSSISTIPTATRGWSKRSQRGRGRHRRFASAEATNSRGRLSWPQRS
jgi:catechol 2,3-dioxygenase-like lactoylglutathione lyase family enzyme